MSVLLFFTTYKNTLILMDEQYFIENRKNK